MQPRCKNCGASDPATQGSAHIVSITRIRTRRPLTSFLSLGLPHSASSIVLRLGCLVAGLHGLLLSSAPAGGADTGAPTRSFQGGFWAAEHLATATRIVVMRLIRRCSRCGARRLEAYSPARGRGVRLMMDDTEANAPEALWAESERRYFERCQKCEQEHWTARP